MAFQHILVPVDGSETSYAAVAKAVELAKAFGSKVTVAQVLTLDPYIASEYISAGQTNDLIERARVSILKTLDEAKAKFQEQGVAVESRLLEGQVIHREIARAATEMNADLIVIDRKSTRLNSSHVRNRHSFPTRRSSDLYIASEYISAGQTNDLIERARVSILKTLDEAKAKFQEQGVAVESRLLEGQVIHREIARAATEMNADLIVMGSHGRTGLKKLFLGSVAQSVLGEGNVPVLIVR